MNNEIFLDTQSGISTEEQQEILTQINGIAEKNKQRLSQTAAQEKGKTAVKTAKKKSIFPVAVNIAAAAVLIAGSFLLVSFNTRADLQARTGNAVLNITEKALIDEIRRETAEKISAKEREIASISSRLDEVDAQLMLLQSGNQELTSEQLTSRETLLLLQSSYRSDLTLLNAERSHILEDSRSREERLRVVLDERTKELAAQRGYSSELENAVNELERLTNEQEKIASIDAQVSGGFSLISELIKNGRGVQASLAISSLRNFCNTNTLASSASFQSRKAIYNQSLDLMEVFAGELAGNSAVKADSGNAANNAANQELTLANAQLEETIAAMQKTIDSFSTGGSAQERRIAELNDTVSNLRGQNASLTNDAAAKDRNIQTLQGENNTLMTANAGLTSTNAGLSSQLSEIRSANAAQEQRITDLENQRDAILELLRNN